MAYAFLGIYIVILIFCYVAGSPALTSANEQIEESD
ncbi:hypothetical protein J2X90_000720 [Variovorax paradoxus]|nr:hypothetical protein [Variovorax paradoxus]